MKNWLFFPQGYVQMIFILLTQWKIQWALCLLSYLLSLSLSLSLMCIITVLPTKRNRLLCLGSQIISCCWWRSWCRSKLGSMTFPFKWLISYSTSFYQFHVNWGGRTKVSDGQVECKQNIRVMEVGHLRAQGRQRHSLFCPSVGLVVKGANGITACGSVNRVVGHVAASFVCLLYAGHSIRSLVWASMEPLCAPSLLQWCAPWPSWDPVIIRP